MTPKNMKWMNCTNCGFGGYMPDKSTCPTCRGEMVHQLPDKDELNDVVHELTESAGDWKNGKTERMNNAVRNLRKLKSGGSP